MLIVQDIREYLAGQLQQGWFVDDKSGFKTIELIGYSFHANENTIFGEPNFNYINREIAWYRSQSLDINDIKPPIPKIWQEVASPQGKINSNYGYLFYSYENHSQFSNVISELTDNPYSRRAEAIYIRPSMHEDIKVDGTKDFICTNTVQYLIRPYENEHRLHAVVNMRSNDVIFGYRNDWAWQMYALSDLYESLKYSAIEIDIPNLKMGHIIWQCGSLHVYERDFPYIEHFIATGNPRPTKEELNTWPTKNGQHDFSE